MEDTIIIDYVYFFRLLSTLNILGIFINLLLSLNLSVFVFFTFMGGMLIVFKSLFVL